MSASLSTTSRLLPRSLSDWGWSWRRGGCRGRRGDRVVGLDDVRVDLAMVRTPDGHGRLELTKFHTPTATTAEPNAPPNTLGIPRIMFAVDDLEDVLARLHTHGAELVGELDQYEDSDRLCYVRGPRASSSRWPSSSAEAASTTDVIIWLE